MVSAIKHPAIQAAEQFPRCCPCHFMWQWLTAKWIPIGLCVPHTLFSTYSSIQFLLVWETGPVQGHTVVRQARGQSLAHIPPRCWLTGGVCCVPGSTKTKYFPCHPLQENVTVREAKQQSWVCMCVRESCSPRCLALCPEANLSKTCHALLTLL